MLANIVNPAQQGGTIEIGTVGVAKKANGVVQIDPTYGYEEVSSANSGTIKLGGNALIDVSGGTAGGLSGGTVNFRAPLLDNGEVNVNVFSGVQIKGSRSTTLEAFAVWSTDDPQTNGASEHFDGIVDPAGWYNSVGPNGTPQLVAGTFTEQSTSSTPPTFTFTPDVNGDGGGTVTNTTTNVTTALSQQQVETGDSAIGFGGLQNDYFAPNASDVDTASSGSSTATKATARRLARYGIRREPPDRLGRYKRFTNAGIPITIAPGIELDNPDPNINSGNISILTNWNLGAGNSQTDLAFRYQGEAPIITFRAENDVKVDASIERWILPDRRSDAASTAH